MDCYDPVSRRLLVCSPQDPHALVTLPPVGIFTPTRANDPGSPWFVRNVWRNESLVIAELPEGVRAEVTRAIATSELCERLARACADAREAADVPPMDESDASLSLESACEGVEAGDVALVIESVRARGFCTSEIAFALHSLHAEPALSDALDSVEVVSVRQLAEKLRARG